MNYAEKLKAINYLKKCKKNTINLEFTYKNFYLLIQMIFKVKRLMEEFDDDRQTNDGLNHIVNTINHEVFEAISAKEPADIRDKFGYAIRRFNNDLGHCLIVLGFYNE